MEENQKDFRIGKRKLEDGAKETIFIDNFTLVSDALASGLLKEKADSEEGKPEEE